MSRSPAKVDTTVPFRIRLLATGGTLEKTYDPATGQLTLDTPVIAALVDALVLPDTEVTVERLMACDSLDMTDDERARIVAAAGDAARAADAVLVTHGTDTLEHTARALIAAGGPPVPVVLTGAMVPYRVNGSDALANVAQAVLACRMLAPGVHVVFHGRVIPGEHVVKNHERATLEARVPRAD